MRSEGISGQWAFLMGVLNIGVFALLAAMDEAGEERRREVRGGGKGRGAMYS